VVAVAVAVFDGAESC